MKNAVFCGTLILLLTGSLALAGDVHSGHPAAASSQPNMDNASRLIASAETTLPALPEGVTALKFGEIFKSPVGSRGLEMTDKLRDLEGKKVRILGYMVQDESADPNVFLLSPMPFRLHRDEYGLCDDLPGSVISVHLPASPEKKPAIYTPGLLLLTGTLAIGNHEEKDGRLSFVRLVLDPTSSPQPFLSPVN